jgi:hypothetical protein
MDTTVALQRDRLLNVVKDFAKAQCEEWLQICNDFRAWERKEILLGNPTSEITERHRQNLRYMITMTRAMLLAASDPEMAGISVYSDLDIMLHQLEDSWEMFYNPMPREKANEILAAAFPQ